MTSSFIMNMFWLLVRGIYLSFQGIIQTSSGKEKSTLIISTYEKLVCFYILPYSNLTVTTHATMQQPAKISVICYFLFVSYVCVCALACTLLSIFLFKLDTFMCFGFPKSRLQYVTHIILIIVERDSI
jgi:hypothetical protein